MIQSSSVYGYAINPATGALTAAPGSPFESAVGPTALAFDLYVAADAYDSIDVYAIESSGELSVNVPRSPFGIAHAVEWIAGCGWRHSDLHGHRRAVAHRCAYAVKT